MKLQKRIQRKIEKKLIPKSCLTPEQSKICKKLAEEIILEIEADWNKRKNNTNPWAGEEEGVWDKL